MSDPSGSNGSNEQTQTGQPHRTFSLEELISEFSATATRHGVVVPPALQAALSAPSTPGGRGTLNESAIREGNAAFDTNAPQNFGNRWADGASGPARLNPRSRNEFERVTGDIPIEKFPYGTPGADWGQWSQRFEIAVQASTNAYGRERLEELCLLWIPLKLNEEAQPIYSKAEYKGRDWNLLQAELAEAFEDPRILRQWARKPDAYKKPAGMSLQVYKANIIGYVHKFSPHILGNKNAYAMELYNRFTNGLEADWKEYIQESIPYGKETLDNAYSQALKYEDKLASKSAIKAVGFTGAAMTDAEKDSMEKMRLDLEQVKTQLKAQSLHRSRDQYRSSSKQGKGSSEKKAKEPEDGKTFRKNSPYPKQRSASRQSGSGRSTGRSRSGSTHSKNSFRAVQTEAEDSDAEVHAAFVQKTSDAIAKAVADSLQGLSLKVKDKTKKKSRTKKE